MAADNRRVGEAKKFGRANTFAVATGRVYSNRTLFVAGNGSLGLAPLAATQGDQIWFLAGAKVPYILRPTDEADTFELVGEAYLHGYMHGEAANVAGNLKRVILK